MHKEILERTYDLISKGWHQNNNSNGKTGTFTDEDATAFCLDGALLKATAEVLELDTSVRHIYHETKTQKEYEEIINRMTEKFGFILAYPHLTLWNDDKNRTKDEVLGIVRELIEESDE